jgi:tRNA modification GTPase
VVRALFRPHSRSGAALPESPELGRYWLGRLGDTLSDEVVLAVTRVAPMPWLEVHCHGGRQVIGLVVETLEAGGLRSCTWQELERATADDPLQALAAVTLAEARTARTAAILLDQHQGALGRALDAISAALDRDDRALAGRLLEELARWAALGRHLTAPWRVTVAGPPNVGKSSLVNALAGYQRSVVDPTPGTTRDVVTTLLAIDGWPVELSDTAGLRDAAGDLESQGIRQARTALASADLCLWVLDASAPPVWPPSPAETVRLVVNKVDLPAAWDLDQAAGAVQVSARTGAGLTGLCRSLGCWLVPDAPTPGAAAPFNASLCDLIVEGRDHLAAGRLTQACQALEAARRP